MGVVAAFETVPIERRDEILTRIVAAGVELEDEGDERGLYWYGCRRGQASIGLFFDPTTSQENVCLYCGYFKYLRRLRSTERLFRDVLSAVRDEAGHE